MKFIALLIATANAAEVANFADCSAADATCAAASCCGTVTGTGGPATKVCAVTPTDAEITASALGTDYIITAAVAMVGTAMVGTAASADYAVGPPIVGTAASADYVAASANYAAAVVEVKGTFLCAPASGASYMTVGAAAMVAAAALLQ